MKPLKLQFPKGANGVLNSKILKGYEKNHCINLLEDIKVI